METGSNKSLFTLIAVVIFAGNPLESIKIPLTMQTKIVSNHLILGKYAPANLIMTTAEAATLYDSSLVTYY